MEIHRSARRHDVGDNDIRHAVDHPMVVVDLDSDADPPKLLIIGPDRAGNLLEVIMLSLDGDELLAIHAMPARTMYLELLSGESDD